MGFNKIDERNDKTIKINTVRHPDETKASKSIKQILGSLSSVVQGIGEIRSKYGSGHGKGNTFKGLQPRHAKLAVGTASTLVIYLLETHKIRIE